MKNLGNLGVHHPHLAALVLAMIEDNIGCQPSSASITEGLAGWALKQPNLPSKEHQAEQWVQKHKTDKTESMCCGPFLALAAGALDEYDDIPAELDEFLNQMFDALGEQ